MLLSAEEIKEGLKGLHGWRSVRKYIAKSYDFESFADAMRFVNSVADVAEKMDHHPDMKIVYTKVTLKIQTHSEGGVTKRDFRLAEAIDRVS